MASTIASIARAKFLGDLFTIHCVQKFIFYDVPDTDECLRRPPPCQHICHNVLGSFTCSCHSCYTKVGTRCELRQCRIANVCYAYGRVNPRNKCQVIYHELDDSKNDANFKLKQALITLQFIVYSNFALTGLSERERNRLDKQQCSVVQWW